MSRKFSSPVSSHDVMRPCYSRFLTLTMFISIITGTILISGCTAPVKDPVIGTWEWSDGKGYTESYTFNPDHSFSANALGSAFKGTWETVSSGHYLVTYYNSDNISQNETLTEQVLYDSKTDAIYFPAHHRVL